MGVKVNIIMIPAQNILVCVCKAKCNLPLANSGVLLAAGKPFSKRYEKTLEAAIDLVGVASAAAMHVAGQGAALKGDLFS